MANEENQETFEEGTPISNKIFLFLIIGIATVVVGMIMIFIAAVLYDGGSASAGAVIFIGPFPIIIGVGPDAPLIVLFSIIIAILSIAVFLVINKKLKFSG